MELSKDTFDRITAMFPGYGKPCYAGVGYDGLVRFKFRIMADNPNEDIGFIAEFDETITCRNISGLTQVWAFRENIDITTLRTC